jgi:hypothetical protein
MAVKIGEYSKKTLNKIQDIEKSFELKILNNDESGNAQRTHHVTTLSQNL